ncbi:hypothetical protein [Anaeromassilibacillus sp. An200]|uniref:hypothetical protein n=1 Tax=Anaeromassilibacillus sp. An200 TaxID=1965587 RepID=UPI00111EB8F5|nr:hypothetical protein [Anaeromassilibacillus sp. An200]
MWNIKERKHEVFARLFQKAAGIGAEPHKILRSHEKARKKSAAIFFGPLSQSKSHNALLYKKLFDKPGGSFRPDPP